MHIDIIETAIRGGRSVTVRVIPFSPVSTIPPLLHTHLHVYVSVTGRKSGRKVEKFNAVLEIGKRCVGRYCNCCSFKGGNTQRFTVAISMLNMYEQVLYSTFRSDTGVAPDKRIRN